MAPRKKGPKQEEIEATRSDRHKDIDAAAERFREKRDLLRDLKDEVDVAKDEMKAAMMKHNLKVYPLEGTDPPEEVVIEVAHEEAKIRKAKAKSNTFVD